MQTRIDYLNEQLTIANEAMATARDLGTDLNGYLNAKADYDSLAGERNWLQDIFANIPMTILEQKWEETKQYVHMDLVFDKIKTPSPLNEIIYDDKHRLYETMDFVKVPVLMTGFAYALEFIDTVPGKHMADELVHNYLHAKGSPLGDMVEAVDLANIALAAIEFDLSRDHRFGEGWFLVEQRLIMKKPDTRMISDSSVSPDNLTLKEWEVQRAVNDDNYLLYLQKQADKIWPLVRKLIVHSMSHRQYEIKWSPFKLDKTPV